MPWLYSLLLVTSGKHPALFMLGKAEVALSAELPKLQPAPAGSCATGSRPLASSQPWEGRAEQRVYRSAGAGDAHPHLLRFHGTLQPSRAKAPRSSGSCQSAAVESDSSLWLALDAWNIIASLLVLQNSLLQLN